MARTTAEPDGGVRRACRPEALPRCDVQYSNDTPPITLFAHSRGRRQPVLIGDHSRYPSPTLDRPRGDARDSPVPAAAHLARGLRNSGPALRPKCLSAEFSSGAAKGGPRYLDGGRKRAPPAQPRVEVRRDPCYAVVRTRRRARARIPLVDFGKPDELRRWLGEQPRQVSIALAARAALRVLAIIGTPSATAGTGPLLLADAIHVQTHFRLLSTAWAAFGQSFGDPWIAARARSAAAARLPIGTLFTSPAASTARLSAATVVGALTTSGQDSIDTLVAAIREAYSAEAEFPDDARGASALAGDVEFLAGRGALRLNREPLWPNRPPTWFDPRWRDLKAFLQRVHQDWQVWTIWYDDRLARRVNSIPREVAYVDVSDELWARGRRR